MESKINCTCQNDKLSLKEETKDTEENIPAPSQKLPSQNKICSLTVLDVEFHAGLKIDLDQHLTKS